MIVGGLALVLGHGRRREASASGGVAVVALARIVLLDADGVAAGVRQ